ncbi:hypothetical protein EXIGLDRAFT_766220 [Exidia glandulosa HHB12029]|uniref:Uncharacterized protein n=1 Tax=Exidia glandulosa HHB12029 TaxID=1314781 RepID=A0A166AV11_EXIGL|nr:hypothetical protein EXIGLDRAFT_766220 [Exidia glandulosa HHB12029]
MANNTQAAFNLTADRAAVIAAEMLVVVCGDRQAARAAVAYTFLATAVYAAFAHHRGRVPHTAYIALGALAAVWSNLTAAPTPTPTAPAA